MKNILGLAIAAVALSETAALGQRSMSAVPATDANSWFNADDYPKGATLGNRQGRVGARLSIDTGGSVVGCTIEESSGTTMLDEKTCAIVKERGRFNPATDRKGRPIVGTYLFHTRWVLPDGASAYDSSTIPPRQSYTMEVYYNADGVVASCHMIERQPADPKKTDACPREWVGRQAARMMREGKPVPYRIVQRVSQEVSITE